MSNHPLTVFAVRRSLTTIVVVGAVICGGSSLAAAADSPTNLSLARTYPLAALSEILVSRDLWRPFPTIEDRERWPALPQAVQTYLVARGEEALRTPWPGLPATLYLGYAREGNRARFEAVYFERRALLQQLVLAECVEAKGRFLDAAADALWALCEESTWCLPAHVGVQKARVGLPDVTEPVVDLFAGESGVTVAWTLYLLGAQLDRVSPQLRRRAALELDRRVLRPVLDRDDLGWMALNVTRPEQRPNNWTPWIAASVLTADLLCEPDHDRRARIAHKMLRSLDGFLVFHPPDGSCDEGPGYWGQAGGSLFDALEILHSATGGKLDVYGDPLVRNIGQFIVRAHIAGDYFVPVGDCAARFEPDRGLVFRYGKRIHDPTMQALASAGASVESIMAGRFFGRQLPAVFEAGEILAAGSVSAPLLREVWLPSDDLQLMTARSRAGSPEGLFVAAWGAHNAQSHNHNDVGNVLVFADGQPVLVDAGAPTYTAQTFSSKRYEHWAFQSAFHNLPTINGVMQGVGRSFAATRVRCQTNDAFAELQMDLGPAYPATARVKSWLRTVRLNRGQSVEIIEAFELEEAVSATTLNFLTPLEADTSRPGRVILTSPAQSTQPSVRVRLQYDSAKLAPVVERLELNDTRLAKSWGTHLNRLVLQDRSAVLKDVWTLRLTQESRADQP